MPKAILASKTAYNKSPQVDTPKKAKPHHERPLAALYCRVSTSGQEEDGTSLDTQEARCRHYATEQGYLLDEAHVYREVYTGTELWERPKLTALREAIRQGGVTHLVAYAIDRLSRDPVHLGVILSEAEHHGVVVEFVSEPLDHSPEGQLIRFNQARPYLLRGIVVGAVCGRKMRPGPESRGRLIYRCASRETPSGPCGSKRVPAADLEQRTWEQVCILLRNPSLIATELERQRQEGPDQRLLADKDALQRSLAKLGQQQGMLLRLFRGVDEEHYPVDLIQRELAQIEKEKAHLAAALTQIEAQ
jgi:predicted site-specific integrase-resolvase